MGHRLRQFQQPRRQVLGAGERDAELAGPEIDGGGQVSEAAVDPVGGGGELDAAGRALAPGPVQFFDDAAQEADFPLIGPRAAAVPRITLRVRV